MSKPFMQYTLVELRQKRLVASLLIRALRGPWKDDERSGKILEKYVLQRKQIDEAIVAKKKEAGTYPEPTTVGMKAAQIKATAKKGG